jgi:hypothetical protein
MINSDPWVFKVPGETFPKRRAARLLALRRVGACIDLQPDEEKSPVTSFAAPQTWRAHLRDCRPRLVTLTDAPGPLRY